MIQIKDTWKSSCTCLKKSCNINFYIITLLLSHVPMAFFVVHTSYAVKLDVIRRIIN